MKNRQAAASGSRLAATQGDWRPGAGRRPLALVAARVALARSHGARQHVARGGAGLHVRVPARPCQPSRVTSSSGGTTPATSPPRPDAGSATSSRSSASASIRRRSNPSRWAIRDIHMAHLAVSDPRGQRYRFDERLSRSGPGLSGAATDRYGCGTTTGAPGWTPQGQHALARDQSRRPSVELVLDPGKPPAVNGVNGISQKGARPGQRLALLLAHPDADARHARRRRRAVRGQRRELDGPRVRHQLPRARAAGLGLAVDPARRRARADALPAAPSRRHPRPAIERHARRRAGPHHASRRRRLHDDARPARTFTAPSGAVYPVALDGRDSRRSSSRSRSRRRSTTRSWPRAAPASPIGKA